MERIFEQAGDEGLGADDLELCIADQQGDLPANLRNTRIT
jgi:hypothetical protein